MENGLERATAAVDDLLGMNGELCATPEEVARAVIASIRPPSEAMLRAPDRNIWFNQDDDDLPTVAGIWCQMIDALLEEGR